MPETTNTRFWHSRLARTAAMAALLTTLLAMAFAGLRLARTEVPPADTPLPDLALTDVMWPASNRIEAQANTADGQVFVAIARDPLGREPEHYYAGSPELVYRTQRPLNGWVVLIGSLGQEQAMPWVLFVVTCLSVGCLAAVSVIAAADEGKEPRYGAATVLMPGVMLSVVLLVPEPLPAALGLAGLVLWRRGHIAWSILAFSAGVLGRELIVLVPLALALNELFIGKRRIRDVAPLALSVVPYALWVVSLHERYGTWPWEGTPAKRGALPFTGWISAVSHLEAQAAFSILLAIGLLALVIAKHRRSPYAWAALLLAASTIVLGDDVLSTEPYRPLLPMYVIALIIVLPTIRRPRSELRSQPTRTRPEPA